MARKSCWGCGKDYLEFGWSEKDFTAHEKDGEEIELCPECYEEVVDFNSVVA